MVTACPSHEHLVHVHTQILSKGSAGSDLKLSKTEKQGSAVTPGVEEEEETGRQLPRGRLQWFLMLDYRIPCEKIHKAGECFHISLSLPLSLSLFPLISSHKSKIWFFFYSLAGDP